MWEDLEPNYLFARFFSRNTIIGVGWGECGHEPPLYRHRDECSERDACKHLLAIPVEELMQDFGCKVRGGVPGCSGEIGDVFEFGVPVVAALFNAQNQ